MSEEKFNKTEKIYNSIAKDYMDICKEIPVPARLKVTKLSERAYTAELAVQMLLNRFRDLIEEEEEIEYKLYLANTYSIWMEDLFDGLDIDDDKFQPIENIIGPELKWASEQEEKFRKMLEQLEGSHDQ